VITSYEIYELDLIVHEIDDDAFIKILRTHSEFCRFANENEQKMYRTTGVSPEIKHRSQKK
ncbi:YitT family protein, partial [Enterococcus faecium]